LFYLVTLIMCLGFEAFSGTTLIFLWLLHAATSDSCPMPARITANYLYLTDWSSSELRILRHPDARVPFTNWMLAKVRRSHWIAIQASVFRDKSGIAAAGYELKKKGELIESGEFDWPHGSTVPDIIRIRAHTPSAAHAS
jgi:hypothetical protein